jgi:hypothetical protein
MIKKNKRLRILVVALIFTIIFFIAILPFIMDLIKIHRNRLNDGDIIYDDNFIIGNNYNNIVREYGAFDIEYGYSENESLVGGYLLKYDSINGNERFYFVSFDSKKIATETYISIRPGG